MSDDLLDEATRLADAAEEAPPWRHAADLAPTVRALVERVQQAEAERDHVKRATTEAALTAVGAIAKENERARAERDAARAKLDAVHQGLLDEIAKFEHGDSEEGWPVHNLCNVLAILDRQEPPQAHETAPVRPESCQLATEGAHGTNGPQNGTHETQEP